MKVHELPKIITQKKRLARGNAGKGGTTAGRGTKGQRARTSKGNIPSGFEGGQTPLKARLPQKKGFFPYLRTEYQVVNLGTISVKFKDGDKIDNEKLLAAHLISNLKRPVKILGGGELTKRIEIKAAAFSKGAIAKIEKAGGKQITE